MRLASCRWDDRPHVVAVAADGRGLTCSAFAEAVCGVVRVEIGGVDEIGALEHRFVNP